MRTITLAEVVTAGEKAVKERPAGFRYDDLLNDTNPRLCAVETYEDHMREEFPEQEIVPLKTFDCEYLVKYEDGTDKPGCIVGVILSDLGVDHDILAEIDKATDPVIAESGEMVLSDHDIYLDPAALCYLRAAQVRQDRQVTWAVAHAEAVAEAEKRFPNT